MKRKLLLCTALAMGTVGHNIQTEPTWTNLYCAAGAAFLTGGVIVWSAQEYRVGVRDGRINEEDFMIRQAGEQEKAREKAKLDILKYQDENTRTNAQFREKAPWRKQQVTGQIETVHFLLEHIENARTIEEKKAAQFAYSYAINHNGELPSNFFALMQKELPNLSEQELDEPEKLSKQKLDEPEK